MVAILVKKKGGRLPATPSYSREIMSSTDYFLRRNICKGRVASLRRPMKVFSVESRTMTSAYRILVCSYVKYPSITSQPSLERIRHWRSRLGTTLSRSGVPRRTNPTTTARPKTRACRIRLRWAGGDGSDATTAATPGVPRS